MAYIKNEVDRLPLPSDPQFWVEMRRSYNWGTKRKVAQAQLSPEIKQALQNAIANGLDLEDPANQKELAAEFATEADNMTANALLVMAMISDWNLTDENEEKLPLTPTSLDLLADEDGDFLLTEAGKRVRKAPVAQVPLDEQSTPPSTETAMEIPESDVTPISS